MLHHRKTKKRAIGKPEMNRIRDITDDKQLQQAEEEQNPKALLNLMLRTKVQLNRVKQGKEEMQVHFEPPKSYDLSDEEKAKQEQRRLRNRRAAKESRDKKKQHQETLQKENKALEEHQSQLKTDIREWQNLMLKLQKSCWKIRQCTYHPNSRPVILPPASQGTGHSGNHCNPNQTTSDRVPLSALNMVHYCCGQDSPLPVTWADVSVEATGGQPDTTAVYDQTNPTVYDHTKPTVYDHTKPTAYDHTTPTAYDHTTPSTTPSEACLSEREGSPEAFAPMTWEDRGHGMLDISFHQVAVDTSFLELLGEDR